MVWSTQDVLESFQRVSNWGRWGVDDERGTLNYITPEKVVEAAQLVRSGLVVSASLDLSTETTAWSKGVDPLIQEFGMTTNGTFVFETSTIYQHGWERTHLDAPAHALHDGHVFGGRRVDEVWDVGGLRFGSIHALRGGIVTRGVLLDVAAARGVPWIEPGDTIHAEDLDAAERLAGTTVTTGDAVFLRAGVMARAAALGPQDPASRTGPAPDCAIWLHDRQVALLASDCPEKSPPPYPEIGLTWHIATLVYMGLQLLDAPAMEPLLEACRDQGRNEFLLSVAPLRFPRATGSLCNPLCIF